MGVAIGARPVAPGTYVASPAVPSLNGGEFLVPGSSANETKWAFAAALGLAINAKDHAATAAQRAVVGVPNPTTGLSVSKPLSDYYGSLAAAQLAYPTVADLALTDELDSVVAQAALDASITTGDPKTVTRASLKPVFFPGGVYRMNRRLHLQSVNAPHIYGAGGDQTEFAVAVPGAGVMEAFFDVDGSHGGVFRDFRVRAISGTVNRPVSLDWSGNDFTNGAGLGITFRSSSSNEFHRIYVNGTYKWAFAIGTRSGNRQVDNTGLFGCLATGQWVLDSVDTTLYQAGFQIGSGTPGNIIGTHLHWCSSVKNKYGTEGNQTNYTHEGAQPSHNQVDFHQTGAAAEVRVSGVRSEGARRLWEDTSTSAAQVVSLSDIHWAGHNIAADGRWIAGNKAGHLKLDGVSTYATGSVVPVVYHSLATAVAITAVGLVQPTPVESGFSVGASCRVIVVNYTENVAATNVTVKTTPFYAQGVLDVDVPWGNRIDVERLMTATRTSRIVASDDFNRADGAIGTSTSGHVWNSISGTWAVLSNKARESIGTGNRLVVLDLARPDIEVEVEVTMGASIAGIALRAIDASNFLMLQLSVPSNHLMFRKLDTASFVNLWSITSFGVVNGNTYKLGVRAFGRNFRFYVDGTQRGEYTATTADYTKFGAVTKHGLYVGTDSAARFDNFVMLS